MTSLRPYQQETIDALWMALRRGVASPLACLPTGAGKSIVVATMVRQAVQEWKGRVLVLVHVKELVAQLAESIRRAWPDAFCPLGILSAGLGQCSVDRITVAGIQSAFRRAVEIGRVDLIIVDEAHLIPPDGDGMYRTLLGELRIINPKLRIVGLTATPYRLGHGLVCGEGKVFSELVYDVKVTDLIAGGYLSPMRGKDGGSPDLSTVHHRAGEFVAGEVQQIMEDEERVRLAVAEMVRHGADRRAWLVFCCSVEHARMTEHALRVAGIEAETVTGDTPGPERDGLISRYKARGLRCLVNVNVLTTGFDAPHVDLVVLLRPTESPGLYYQMVGRGFRRAEGKSDCLVLDLAGNIERHGPIETLNERISDPKGGACPTKACTVCEEVNLAGAAECTACHAPFMKVCKKCGHDAVPWTAEVCPKCNKPMRDEARHETVAADGDPITGAPLPDPVAYEVTGIDYWPHEKKNAPPGSPRTLCVEYRSGFQVIAKEWVCVEHPMGSFARTKAGNWLDRRLRRGWVLQWSSDGTMMIDGGDGRMVADAAGIAQVAHASLRVPRTVSVQPDPANPRYTRVVSYTWDETDQDLQPVTAGAASADDEPPF